MYKEFRKNLFWGLIIVAVVGTLGHFFYKWTGKNVFVGLIFPVNESCWEHMKLVFFPMIGLSIYMIMKWKEEYAATTNAMLFGTVLATWLVPIMFYFYRGSLGFGFSVVDMGIYYVALLVSFYVICHIIKRMGEVSSLWISCTLIVLAVIMAILFMYYSYRPLDLAIFKEIK